MLDSTVLDPLCLIFKSPDFSDDSWSKAIKENNDDLKIFYECNGNLINIYTKSSISGNNRMKHTNGRCLGQKREEGGGGGRTPLEVAVSKS